MWWLNGGTPDYQSEVPGSSLASPQPARKCQFLIEKVSRDDRETAGLPLRDSPFKGG